MNPLPAITISRSLGSQGTEVGFKAAQLLGWHFCDRRILRLAAAALGLSTATVARQEEREPGYLDAFLRVLGYGSPEAPCTPLMDIPIYSQELFAVERQVMFQLLQHAPSVLVGRGGFVALGSRPATLHVSIHADLGFRIQSLVARGKMPNREAARQAIEASDQGRGSFIRAISGLDWQDPSHFQMVLDTSRDSFETCVNRLVEEANRRFAC